MTRVLPRVLVALLVLLVLLVVIDRVGAVLAARSVAQGLTTSQRLGGPASVNFPSIPFLTQAAQGRYDTVEVSLPRVPTRTDLVIDRVDATLHGVEAPTGALLRGELRELPVERAEADAFVSYASLESAAARTVGGVVQSLHLTGAGGDRVAVSGRVTTPLGAFTVRGQGQVRVVSGALSVRIVPESLTGVPAVLRARVSQLVDLSALVPPLPFGFRPTAVTVADDGLHLRATASKLTFPV